jgi:hypothetical protein
LGAENLNTYLNDVMGITSESDRWKFHTELKKVKEPTCLEVNLYGWGSNYDGELATFGIKQMQAPKLIDLPIEFRIKMESSHKPKFALETEAT